jgi:hypothetical protein
MGWVIAVVLVPVVFAVATAYVVIRIALFLVWLAFLPAMALMRRH